MTSPYQAMREAAQAKGATPRLPRRFPPEIARERQKENTRRNVEARRRTAMVMAARYPDEWREVQNAERAALDDEKGPMPGDE